MTISVIVNVLFILYNVEHVTCKLNYDDSRVTTALKVTDVHLLSISPSRSPAARCGENGAIGTVVLHGK